MLIHLWAPEMRRRGSRPKEVQERLQRRSLVVRSAVRGNIWHKPAAERLGAHRSDWQY